MWKRVAFGPHARRRLAQLSFVLATMAGCMPSEVISASSNSSGAPSGQPSTGNQQSGATPGGATAPSAGGTTPPQNGAGPTGTASDDPRAAPTANGDTLQGGTTGPGTPNAFTPGTGGDGKTPSKGITLGLVSPRSSPGPSIEQPTDPNLAVLQGDLSRYAYAFFATRNYDVASDTLPFFGLVVTEDANFCTRTAAPLHTADFTAFRLESGQEFIVDANTVYTQTTYPSYNIWYPAYSEQQPPQGSDQPGYQTTCALFDQALGSRSFAQASWTLTPEANQTLQTANAVIVDLKASNSAQIISWHLVAQRCENVPNYFQAIGGNHVTPQTIPCVRPGAAVTTPTADAGQGNVPTNTTSPTGTAPPTMGSDPNAP